MTEILHAWALAPAAIGACCVAADRRRARVFELAASALMIFAMLDAVNPAPVLPTVVWAAVLIACAMVHAGMRGARRTAARRVAVTASPGRMTVHSALGLVLTAALLLGMGAHGAASTGHSHGVGAGGLTALVVLASLGYAAASALWTVRAHGWRERAQFAAMGASTLLMGSAMLVG